MSLWALGLGGLGFRVLRTDSARRCWEFGAEAPSRHVLDMLQSCLESLF